jgi:hypothetical protein
VLSARSAASINQEGVNFMVATNDSTPDYVVIPLTRGLITLLDPIDADFAQLKWHATASGRGAFYATHSVYRPKQSPTVIKLHREIVARMIGRPLARTEFVDHRDGNPLNNRRANLRLATRYENARNRRLGRDNTTGYKGVQRRKGKDVWRSTIRIDGRNKSLGSYRSPREAAIAYNHAAVKYYGVFAKLNEIANWQHESPVPLSRSETLRGRHKKPESIARGEQNGSAKLTSAMVDQMRQEYAAGDVTFRQLATKYGVTATTAHHAVRGNSWKDK